MVLAVTIAQPGLLSPEAVAQAAVDLGHDPAVILSGRAINDGMGGWVADQLSARLAAGARVLVMGLTFKEDVPDLRNSKVADVATEVTDVAGCASSGRAAMCQR